MNAFTNYTLKISITALNANTFNTLYDFGMMADCNATYYVIDNALNLIFLLNDNYTYISSSSFTSATNMININSNLYIIGNSNIWKTDKYLNALITNTPATTSYKGIYYNSTNNLLYLVSSSSTVIDVIDLIFNLNDTISISPNIGRSIAGYNNKIYVGTKVITVLIIVNKIIIQTVNGCLGGQVASIAFDDFDLMAVTCSTDNMVRLYHSNGTLTGKSLSTTSNPRYGSFDSKGRFVIVYNAQVNVYY